MCFIGVGGKDYYRVVCMQLYFGEHSLKKILLGSVAYVMRMLQSLYITSL